MTPDVKERLIREYEQLGERLSALERFLASDHYAELPEIERDDLRAQVWAMREYFMILFRRVSRVSD